MVDLDKHAKRLDSRIKELNLELGKTQGKLAEATKGKEDRLLKSALSPRGNALSAIERLNSEIGYLKQKFEDTLFVRDRLLEELNLTAGKIKEQRVLERQAKVASKESEKQRIIEEIKNFRTKIFKLEGKLRKAFLEGEPLPRPKDGYLNDQILEAQSLVEEAKNLTEEAILGELGITLEEKQDPAPLLFPFRCGGCGYEEVFPTDEERLAFQTRHLKGECEVEKKYEKRTKKEETLILD